MAADVLAISFFSFFFFLGSRESFSFLCLFFLVRLSFFSSLVQNEFTVRLN